MIIAGVPADRNQFLLQIRDRQNRDSMVDDTPVC
jgi:hypothetical protein